MRQRLSQDNSQCALFCRRHALTKMLYALPCYLFSMFVLSCASAVHGWCAFDTLCVFLFPLFLVFCFFEAAHTYKHTRLTVLCPGLPG